MPLLHLRAIAGSSQSAKDLLAGSRDRDPSSTGPSTQIRRTRSESDSSPKSVLKTEVSPKSDKRGVQWMPLVEVWDFQHAQTPQPNPDHRGRVQRVADAHTWSDFYAGVPQQTAAILASETFPRSASLLSNEPLAPEGPCVPTVEAPKLLQRPKTTQGTPRFISSSPDGPKSSSSAPATPRLIPSSARARSPLSSAPDQVAVKSTPETMFRTTTSTTNMTMTPAPSLLLVPSFGHDDNANPRCRIFETHMQRSSDANTFRPIPTKPFHVEDEPVGVARAVDIVRNGSDGTVSVPSPDESLQGSEEAEQNPFVSSVSVEPSRDGEDIIEEISVEEIQKAWSQEKSTLRRNLDDSQKRFEEAEASLGRLEMLRKQFSANIETLLESSKIRSDFILSTYQSQASSSTSGKHTEAKDMLAEKMPINV